MNPEPQLTGGTIATMIVVPLILLLLAAAFVVMRLYARREDGRSPSGDQFNDAVLARRGSWLSLALIVVTVAVTWWWMYPWKSEYHHWVPRSGTVARVDSRLISDGDKSMQTKFVVLFTGDDQQYGVVDTRVAGVKAGDRLAITCVRIWQFSGTDGYDCNFVSLEHK